MVIEDLSSSAAASVSLRQLVDWRRKPEVGALQLPPIQRSLVWRNEQIINYWDSLLRGYPPGTFLVHEISETENAKHSAYTEGTDHGGQLISVRAGDWQLFDGQQRISTLLLGYGAGQLANDLRLWIDLGAEVPARSGLKYALRISSKGQPFGYQLSKPNSKEELAKRAELWRKFEGQERDDVFKSAEVTLIGGMAPVPLTEAIAALEGGWEAYRDKVIEAARRHADPVPEEVETQINATGPTFFEHLNEALDTQAVVSKLPAQIVGDPEEYTRFFERLGQGGTALTDNELTYSIIKQKLPHVRQRMTDMKNQRFASEVDLILATLRLARLNVERENKEKEGIARPRPDYVKTLPDADVISERDSKTDLKKVRDDFLRLLPKEGGDVPIQHHLTRLIEMLEAEGMPRMLIARLPSEAVDMLLLLVEIVPKERDGELQKLLRAFTLFCLLAVKKADRCANSLFHRASAKDWSPLDGGLKEWRDHVVKEGFALHTPTNLDMNRWRAELDEKLKVNGLAMLPAGDERFVDFDAERQPGEWVRQASRNHRLIKNALMWVQRGYLHKTAKGFDPLSARDDDLPLDLDHIVPHDHFGFYASTQRWTDRINTDLSDAEKNAFYHHRGIIGNSLGNYRWLCARENRRRQNGPLEESLTLREDHLIGRIGEDDEEQAWRDLVGETAFSWGRSRISTFWYRVELRALEVLERCVHDMSFENT